MSAPGTRGAVLIVDDEPYVRDSLATVLARRGFDVRTAAGPEEALGALAGVDVVVTDLKMPGGSGLELVQRLSERGASPAVIVLTGYGTVHSAVECMKAGARDYLLKPVNPEELVRVLDRALAPAAPEGPPPGAAPAPGSSGQEGPPARRPPARVPPSSFAPARAVRPGERALGQRPLLGDSEPWLCVLRLVELAAPADTSVLLLGESGTGKEELARLLHGKSQRRAGPFVCVNCAAVPTELFESEFFGHRRGAFTGAVAEREGRFRAAHRGTLFLDEINSLAEAGQAKILRVLQDGLFEVLGESSSSAVDVRLVSASNADLEAEVAAGRFRTDLFYRVNVMTIQVPPLRERRADIPLLAAGFLEEFSRRLGRAVRRLHPEALAILCEYPWPGNVRELRNVVERGVLLTEGEELLPSSLPLGLQHARPAEPDLNLRNSLAGAERRILEEALARTNGVRRDVARLLGIDERNLAYYLRKHGLMDRGKRRP
jgi:two-component system, NtrC family, response regulator AtoC